MDAQARRRGILIGQGGIGLVMFHLARLGHEFVTTTGDSPLGDIWAHVDGRKVGFEVKTSRSGETWFVPRRQIAAVDFYCFVSLSSASTYVLTAEEVSNIAKVSKDTYAGVCTIHARQFPAGTLEAWHKLLSAEPPPLITKPERKRRPNIVRKTLADGSVKEYRYARLPSRAATARALIPTLAPLPSKPGLQNEN